MRKQAITVARLTNTGLDFYMNIPIPEFMEIQQEVAEEWDKQHLS